MNLRRKVPDSITSWIITGFSINSADGLGLIKEPKKLTVFQPFFISLNLPYSVKRGETVIIPCTIFNYMDNDVEATVTLENKNNEFVYIDSQKGNRKGGKTIICVFLLLIYIKIPQFFHSSQFSHNQNGN